MIKTIMERIKENRYIRLTLAADISIFIGPLVIGVSGLLNTGTAITKLLLFVVYIIFGIGILAFERYISYEEKNKEAGGIK